MPRLPVPGADDGNWGNILNEFLNVAHNTDGSLKPTAGIPDDSITTNKIVNGAVTQIKIDPALIDPAAGVAGLRTLGTGANQAMPGNATVSASPHAATHKGGGSDPIDAATGSLAGLMGAGDKNKLDGIASGATANSPDATLLARANHTGTQSADTLTDGTTNHVFTAADDTKLAGIATGATANSTDAQLRDRSTHTGTQTASTISDFDVEVSNNTDVAANTTARHTHSNASVLNATTASFTTADETKLDAIEANADVTDATNVASAGAVMEADTSTASMQFVVDEDDMASNSATKVPTQQSVKAYVDSTGSGTGDVNGPGSSTADAVVIFDGTTGKLIKDSQKMLPNGVLVGDNDTQTLTSKTLTSPVLDTGVSGSAVDTDTTLAANSDTILASQKATKGYIDTVIARPKNDNGVGLRPKNALFDAWLAKLEAQYNNPTPTAPLDIIVIGDSCSSIVSPWYTGTMPWPSMLNILGSETTFSTEFTGWRYGGHPVYNELVMDATQGALRTTATGGYGTRLTVGQFANQACFANYLTVVYSKIPGGGNIGIYDSVFTLLGTINTAGTAKSGFIHELTLTPNLGGRYYGTIFLVAEGGTVDIDGVHFRSSSSGARIINAAHAGYQTNAFTANPSRALDYIENNQPDLTLIMVGVNDGPSLLQTRLTDLVVAAQALNPNNLIALIGFYETTGSNTFTNAMSDIVKNIADTYGCLFIDVDSAYPDFAKSTLLAGDTLHPSVSGHRAIAELVRGVLTGDPIGNAYSLASKGTGYVPAVPASWPAASISVSSALDHLASTGSGKTSRSVVSTSGSATMGATAATDYVYLVTGGHIMTLPTAVSNTNRYTIKNNHSAAITVNTTSSQTIDGTTSISVQPSDSVDIISNNANWSVI